MMELNADQLLEYAIKDGIREGVKSKLTGYNSHLDKLVAGAIEAHAPRFRQLLENAISSCLEDKDFCEEIGTAVRKSLAKTLVQRFGGELEKQVNALKSDPMTRARITLAIEGIVKEHCKAN